MADELNKLLISIEADTALLRRALKDADAAVEGHTTKVDQALSKNEGRFRRYNQTASDMTSKLAATFSLGSILAFTADASKAAAELDDLTKSAGMTGEQIQTLRGLFMSAGVESNKSSQSILRFATQMGELRNKSGELYTFLREQDPVLYQQLLRTNSSYEAMKVFAEGVSRLGAAEERATVIKKAFGDEAVRLTAAFEKGAAGIDGYSDKIKKNGAVMTDEAMKAHKELLTEIDQTWEKAKATVANATAEIAKYVAKALRGDPAATNNFYKNLADDWNKVTDAMATGGHVVAQTTGFLTGAAKAAEETAKSYAQLTHGVDDLFDSWKKGTTLGDKLLPKPDYTVIDQIQQLQSSLAAARKETFASIDMEAARSTEQIRRMYATQLMSATEYERARSLIAQTADAQRYNAAVDIENKITSKRIAALNATEGEGLQAIQLAYDMELRDFQDMLRAKTISEAQFNQAREALAQETSGKIKQFMEAEAAKVKQTLQPIQNAIESSLGNAWDNVWQSGKLDAKSFFADLTAQLARAGFQILALKPLINSLFGSSTDIGGGIVGSIVSSLGFPLKAEGGGVRSGSPVVVGDRGRPEVFVPDTAGSIVPAERFTGGGSGASSQTVYNVDARGADIGAEQRVYSAMARIEAARRSAVTDLSRYANRYPTRAVA